MERRCPWRVSRLVSLAAVSGDLRRRAQTVTAYSALGGVGGGSRGATPAAPWVPVHPGGVCSPASGAPPLTPPCPLSAFQQEGAPHVPERLPPGRWLGTCTDRGQARACGGPLASERPRPAAAQLQLPGFVAMPRSEGPTLPHCVQEGVVRTGSRPLREAACARASPGQG